MSGAWLMMRFLLPVTLISLILLPGSARAEVKGLALVQIGAPKRGSIPDIIVGYGIVESENTLTRSFQRDGQVSNIMVEVGEQFKKGDPLLDFGASPAAVVAYEQAKTALTLAQGTAARTRQLFNLKLATQDQLETAEKAASDARLTKEMYEKLGSTTSEILEAPFDGVVTAISVSKGDRVAAGTALMTLAETDRVRLSVGIEPSQIGRVKTGLPVDLVSLLPGRGPIKAHAKGVGAAIDPKTRLVPVAIGLLDGGALPGENFKAEMLAGKFEGWVIPRDSVQVDKKGTFVFQVDDEHAKRVDVNVLGSAGDTSIIEGDIDPQKKLVLSGSYQIADGDAVRTEEAPLTAAAEKVEGAVTGDQVEGEATRE
jgi:RND family efflux transporter MFP subunit